MIAGEAQLMANDNCHSEDPALDPAAGPIWALGLMSGTSMDGIDAALIRTDGITVAEIGPALARAYDDDTGAALRAAIAGVGAGAVDGVGDEDAIGELERALTDAHGAAVAALLAEWTGPKSGPASMPAVIGFHGHTLWHRPEHGQTRQIGDGARLARQTGIPVIDDFRGADMAAGGQGAPLAPLYHAARLRGADVPYPVSVLNLGGVANVTWVAGAGAGDGAGEKSGAGNGAGENSGAGAEAGAGDESGLLAFDTGPASAMIDDWVRQKTGRPFDEGGALAASGRVDQAVLETMLADPYFDAPPPKSLDRLDFDQAARDLQRAGLSAADGAATLTAFTARTVARAAQFLPKPAKAWYATGGGRHNVTLMAAIGAALGADIRPVEDLGWNGDMLEAEAFAYLAVRSLKGFALSLPATTGVARPTTGGRLHRP